jgi:capsular exopolysaccharide synthesis family protein
MMTPSRPAIRKDIDVLEYWKVVWKRRWVVAAAVGVLLALSALLSFTKTPLYKAVAVLQIEEPQSKMLSVQDILNTATSSSAFMGPYFNTQLQLLQSRSLAERVAKKMNLGARPEVRASQETRRSLFASLRSLLSLRWLRPTPEEGTLPAENAPGKSQTALAEMILDGFGVYPVPETQLVHLDYTSPYPQLAAEIVNALGDEFILYSIESRFAATQQTNEFLNEEIARLRDELASKERELQKYSDDKKIVPLNDRESTIATQYTEVQSEYVKAQAARVESEVKYRDLARLRVDDLPPIVSDESIQTIKTSYLQSLSDYEEKTRTTYRPEHPDMVALKTRIDTLKTRLEGEIRKSVEAAQSEYSRALNREVELKKLLETKRVDVSRIGTDSILASQLQTDVASIRNLLNSLNAKQAETQVSARMSGLRTSNIKVVDRALVPDKPFSPNVKRNLIVALLLGLMLGTGAAFGAHFLDNTVKTPEDLEKLTGLPSLGIIPHFASNGSKAKADGYGLYGLPAEAGGTKDRASEVELINHLFPKISIAKDYRTVRTSILFSRGDGESKVIAFTSTQPREGKSATLSNLAISFAQLGERVLAIDADLRKPRLDKIFKVRNAVGLSDYLAGRAPLEDVVQKTPIDHFWLVPSGPHPPNPAELLNSRKMADLLAAIRKRYDIVLIDLPPVLAVIDPVIVCSQADMTLLVLKTGQTTRKMLLRTIQELQKAKARLSGVIFNDARASRNGQLSPYFQYEYYQDKSLDSPPAKSGPDKQTPA